VEKHTAPQQSCKNTGFPFDMQSFLPAIIPSCQPSCKQATVEIMKITVANSKGGVGKSTLAVHLAVWLFDQGAKVALLDLDKQCSSSRWIVEAESQVTVRTAGTPEICLSELQKLATSHDYVVVDGPAGLNEVSRTSLILADLALLPITPSILDLWSVQEASEILRYAQDINGGRPAGRLVLNKMKSRGIISGELKRTAPGLGVKVTENVIRDLEPFRDAAQQGTVVTRMGKKEQQAAHDINQLFSELLPAVSMINCKKEISNG
jgi:chromosome partitioning protein